MGGGRAPCCDKSKVKKGPWSPAEDLRLITFIQKHGHDNWRSLPKQAGLLRCGKSCRLRWINYLRPDVKRGNFSPEEEDTIIKLHKKLGNKWSKIASQFPGRTDNEIKNVWNTHLKKRLVKKGANINSHGDQTSKDSSTCMNSTSSSSSLMSYDNQEIGNGLEDDQEGQAGSLTNYRTSKVCDKEALEKKQDHSTTEVSSTLSCLTDELIIKEASNSPPSISSHFSNSINQVDVSRSTTGVEMMMSTPLFDYGGPCDILKEVIEIPSEESDTDFWNLLDTLDICLESGTETQPPKLQTSHESSRIEYDRDDEFKKWLRNLENELGLDHQLPTSSTDDIIVNPSNENASDIEMVLRPEIEQGGGMAYFPMWPSSPHDNFSI